MPRATIIVFLFWCLVRYGDAWAAMPGYARTVAGILFAAWWFGELVAEGKNRMRA